MNSQKTVILTGGGSGGHVSPCLSVAKSLEEKGYNLHYVGSFEGIEREMVSIQDIAYSAISTGKLRRYLSFENLKDIFKIIKGIFDAFLILKRFSKKESLVFSCGGFVTVPVVIAAWLQGKKVLVHEQTSRAGLANRINAYFADIILTTFESSHVFFPTRKTRCLGYPLRDEVFGEVQEIDLPFENLEKPLLFITGGGNGAKILNDFIASHSKVLKKEFNIYHQTGKLHLDQYQNLKDESYFCVDVLSSKEMAFLLKKSDVIFSRAGAGTVCELMALGKPSVFVPLKIAQKNEQFFNAKEAEKKLGSVVIEEDNLSLELFQSSALKVRKASSKEVQDYNPKEAIVELIQKELEVV